MTRWTDALTKDLSKEHQTRKKNKYGAKPCEHEGQGFRSQLERDTYAILLCRERAGEIKDLKREQSIQLTPEVKHKLDFVFTVCSTGLRRGVESKGMETDAWSIKKRLYRDFGPFPVEIWKGRNGRLSCVEVIEEGKYKWVLK